MSRRAARARAVVVAIAANVVVWALATLAIGVDLRAPAFAAGAPNPEVGAGTVAVATAAAGLAGWALLAILERIAGRRAAAIWTAAAVVVLLVSFGAPFSGTGADDASRVTLATMHVVAAVVLIPLLSRTRGGSD